MKHHEVHYKLLTATNQLIAGEQPTVNDGEGNEFKLIWVSGEFDKLTFIPSTDFADEQELVSGASGLLAYINSGIVTTCNPNFRMYKGQDISITFTLSVNGWYQYFKLELKKFTMFNGASIPNSLKPIFGNSFEPNYLLPALFHDEGYTVGSLRNYNDVIFYFMLLLTGTPSLTSKTMYLGVRVAGEIFHKPSDSKFWGVMRYLFIGKESPPTNNCLAYLGNELPELIK